MGFSTSTCTEFVEVLASKAPVPGGGGASALVGAVGTALGNMVGSLTVGKKKYADVEEEILEIREKLEQKKQDLVRMVDEDAEAFEPLAKAYRMPKETEKEQAISNKVAGAFGMGSQEGNSQGDAESGTGNQGSPFGNSDHGANEGVGGYGSFNLNGRSIGRGGLPRPAYTIQEEGRIVINITVDPKGNVIFAEIGKGTNIDNGSMRKSALDAAKRAKFNSISGANNQSGTITYLYKLK